MDFAVLAQQCAPDVHPQTMAAVVGVESGYRPFAIGVVGGRLERQPTSKAEAVATARALEAAGYNFSVGMGQVNRYNLQRYGLTYEQAFEPCASLNAGSRILKDCFDRARLVFSAEQEALRAAFSCYYSGNFTRGFKPDRAGEASYVQKVVAQAHAGRAVTVAPPLTRTKPIARGRDAGESADSAVVVGRDDSVMVFR